MEENLNLIVKAVKRVSNKLRDSKVWKKIASLVLAGAVATTFVGCANNSNNNESKKPDDSTTINTDIDKVDMSMFSYLTNNLFDSEECKKLNKAIESNFEKGFYKDVYGNPYTFLKEQGYDVDKIMSGEQECLTSAFVLSTNNQGVKLDATYSVVPDLYMGINVADDTNTYYNQYLIKYNLSEQEMTEYHALHNQRYTQSLYLNNILSQNKTPKLLMTGKINIESYNAIRENLNNYFVLPEYCDYIIKKMGEKNGKPYFKMVAYNWGAVSFYLPDEGTCGIPDCNIGSMFYENFTFDDSVAINIDNGILSVDKSTLKEDVKCGDGDEYDGNHAYKSVISYSRQDMALNLFPQVFKFMTKDNIKVKNYYEQIFNEDGSPAYDKDGNLLVDYTKLRTTLVFFTGDNEEDRTIVYKIDPKQNTKELD